MRFLRVPILGVLCLAPVCASLRADTLIVLNKSEANISLIDSVSGKVLATLPVGDGPHEAATSPDGKTVVVCNYGAQRPGRTLTVIDLPGKKVEATIDLVGYHRPHGIQYLPDGKHLVVTAEAEKKLLIVDVPGRKVAAAIDTGQDISHMVALSKDCKRAFIANIRSGSITVIDLEGRKHIKNIETGAGAEGIAVCPMRPEVWVSNRAADTVTIIRTETLEEVGEMPCASFPIRVAFTPDGKTALVSCAKSGEVVFFDVASRKETKPVKMEVEAGADAEGRLFGRTFGNSPVPVGILVEPEGRLAYIANTNADVVMVIDLATGQIVQRIKAGREPDGMAWSGIDG